MTARLLLLLCACSTLCVSGCSRTSGGEDDGRQGMISRFIPDLPELPRVSLLRQEQPDLTRFPPPAPPEMRREPVRGGLIPSPRQRSVDCLEQTTDRGRMKMVCR